MPVRKEVQEITVENCKDTLFYTINGGLFFCINGDINIANGKVRNREGIYDDVVVNVAEPDKTINITSVADNSVLLTGEYIFNKEGDIQLKVVSSGLDFLISGQTVKLNTTKFYRFSDIYKNGYDLGTEWKSLGLNGLSDDIDAPKQVKVPDSIIGNWKLNDPIWVQNTDMNYTVDLPCGNISLSSDDIIYNDKEMSIGDVYYYFTDAKYIVNYLGAMIFVNNEINLSSIERIEDITEKVNLYFVYSENNENMFIFFNVDGCDSWWFITKNGYMYKMLRE
jgi:hypothetical protein